MVTSIKGALALFSIAAAGVVLFGYLHGFKAGETVTAAATLGLFVIAIAWVAKRADIRLKQK